MNQETAPAPATPPSGLENSDDGKARNNLKRTISLPLLTLYGLGTIVGGGIYALTGKIAGTAGMYAPLSFALAALLALIVAFSYAELAARFPHSAGEARYVQAGYGRLWLTRAIGLAVALTGIVSAATLSVATAGFLHGLAGLNESWAVLLMIGLMTVLALWGIKESVMLVTAITLIEVGGLIYIILSAGGVLADLPARIADLAPPADLTVWTGIFSGMFLAFYAFIGFEDMVNIAEEVKRPRRAMPIAIFLCVGFSLLLYVLISTVAVLAVEPAILAQSKIPLAEITSAAGKATLSVTAIGLISLLATSNGALVQIIMVSRILFGMAREGALPGVLGRIWPQRQTPAVSTLLSAGVVLVLALFFSLQGLAQMTSTLILLVFGCVCGALILIKLRERGGSAKGTGSHQDGAGKEGFQTPLFLPLAGCAACLIMLGFKVWTIFAA